MSGTPTKVLIIENHLLMRAAICNAIADEPDLTIGAIASREADIFEIVETLCPEVILLAVGNPGEEDLKILKEMHEKFPALSILALTSAEVSGQEQAALECGAEAALAKSAQRTDLLKSMRSLMQNRLSEEIQILEREDENK